MTALSQTANIACPDDFYAELIRLHEGLEPQQSAVVSAKLILILANHIGDQVVLQEALALARLRHI